MNKIVLILVFINLFISCNNNSQKLQNNKSRADRLDSLAFNLKYNDIINKPLIEVIKKLDIDIETKDVYFDFIDEPNFDTLNKYHNFSYFLFDNSIQDTKIHIKFDLNYSEIPYHILRKNNDNFLLQKLGRKKVKTLFFQTKNVELYYFSR